MYRASLPLLLCACVAACSTAPHGRATRQPAASGSATSVPNGNRGGTTDLPVFVDHSVGQEEISIQAMSLVGVPYRWGGNSPEGGFDCSGLVNYVVRRAAAVNLPRSTAQISLHGTAIEPGEIATGDLVFFNTTGRAHSHVGIYVGGYRFVNAPSTGGTVRLDSLATAYWGRRFDGIRRVTRAASPPAADVVRAAAPAAPPAVATPVVPTVATPATPPLTSPAESASDPIAAFANGSF